MPQKGIANSQTSTFRLKIRKSGYDTKIPYAKSELQIRKHQLSD